MASWNFNGLVRRYLFALFGFYVVAFNDWYCLSSRKSVTTILAAMLDRGDLLSLVSHAEAKVLADRNLDNKLGVIEVEEIKSILETMGKLDW